MKSVLLLAITALCYGQAPGVSGLWLGTLNGGGGVELRVALHIGDGLNGLTGKMDSLDQGVKGISMSNVKLEAGEFTFEIPMLAGKYKGAVSADRNKIVGTWTQGPAELPLTFVRVDALPVTSRPQDPKRPYPYDEIEVTYENTAQKVKLAGTLTVPRGGKPAPAVILITGSGPQDRNEALMGHKPFLVLADHLTRKGIAVLRVDDRGIGGSTGSFADSTTHDFARDVLAGIAFLKTRSEVDAKRIGLIGHSEGGIIAPIVASQSKDVAFIVLMAGTGVTGEQVLLEQSSAMILGSGGTSEMVKQNQDIQRRMFDVLRTETDSAAMKAKLTEIAGPAEASKASSPWFRGFLTLDPAEYLRKVTCPVLALNGELDLQVVAQQNLPAIEKSLKEAGNRDYTIVKLPKLNHLFQTASKGTLDEYSKIDETIAPVALDTISAWILQRTSVKSIE